jgi:hypothetical protein
MLEQETSKLFRTTGILYGLLFGLSFALFTWGYDALQLLNANSASYTWTKLLLGLPPVLIVGVLVGRLASLSASAAVSTALWAIACGLFGMLAGHLPFDGYNLATWLAESRLWGVDVFHFSYAAQVRTTLIVLTLCILGAAVGGIQSWLLEWIWDHATSKGNGGYKLSVGTWFIFLITLPLAVLPAWTVNGLLYNPLSIPQQRVAQLIEKSVNNSATLNPDSLDYRTIKPYLDAISKPYVTHFVSFGTDTESWYSAYVDVAFDNGLVLRCSVSGEAVVHCADFSQKFNGWMEDLIHAGQTGEQRWVNDRMKLLLVDESVLTWLENHREHLTETYTLTRTGQQGPWVFMTAQFDGGFGMRCRFHGAPQVRVDRCEE